MRTFLGLIAALALGACGGMARSMVHNAVAQKGQVLRTWTLENEERIIVREGNRINYYRIVGISFTLSANAIAEIMYAVDIITETCYTGTKGETPIACDRLSRDADMAPYVVFRST